MTAVQTLASTPLDAGEVDLAVVDVGDGEAPIVLVHGFTGAKEDFGDHVAWLAGSRRTITFDHRGHGVSARTDSYSMGALAGDLGGVVDALGVDRFVLLGHSMGGFVAQLYALAHPERLTGLVLMGTGPAAPRLDESSRGMAVAARRIAVESGMETLLALVKEIGAQSDAAELGSPADDALRRDRPGYAEFCDAKFLATDAVAYDELLGDILAQEDRTEALASLDVPTLVIVGAEDRAFRRAARRMSDAIPGARHVEIPGAGHSPQFEAPEPWRTHLAAFLEEVDQPGSSSSRR